MAVGIFIYVSCLEEWRDENDISKRQFDVYLYLFCISFEPKGEKVFIDVEIYIKRRQYIKGVTKFQWSNSKMAIL